MNRETADLRKFARLGCGFSGENGQRLKREEAGDREKEQREDVRVDGTEAKQGLSPKGRIAGILGERAAYFKMRSGSGWYAEGGSGKIFQSSIRRSNVCGDRLFEW